MGIKTPNETAGEALGAAIILLTNPLSYRGYLYAPMAGYSYYLGSRFYVPTLCRFMNADVYFDTETGVVGTNMFAYYNNNPIMFVDPDGKYQILINKLFNQLYTIMSFLSSSTSWVQILLKDVRFRIDDGYNRNDGNVTNSTKYIIIVDFLNKETIDIWKQKCYKNSKNCDLLTEQILENLKNDYERPFLFDVDCVSFEIRLHLEGYLWSIGKVSSCPVAFSAYYINEKIKGETKSKQEVIFEACKEANIYEYDAVSGTIEAGILGFNYFDGIEKVYRKTKYDPFYDPVTKKRKRDYKNPDWATMPIVIES